MKKKMVITLGALLSAFFVCAPVVSRAASQKCPVTKSSHNVYTYEVGTNSYSGGTHPYQDGYYYVPTFENNGRLEYKKVVHYSTCHFGILEYRLYTACSSCGDVFGYQNRSRELHECK